MSLNLTKTKELVIKIGTCREPPVAVSGIVQVSSLKLFELDNEYISASH